MKVRHHWYATDLPDQFLPLINLTGVSSRHPQLSDGRVAAVFASPGRRTRQEAGNLVEALFGFGKETRPKLGVAKLVSQ